MDNPRLNAILRKLQGQLNENDRRRLINLLNKHKNEKQLQSLLAFFEEIHCTEGVNLLQVRNGSFVCNNTNIHAVLISKQRTLFNIKLLCAFLLILLGISLMIWGMIRLNRLETEVNQTMKQLNEKLERYDQSSTDNPLASISSSEFTEGTTCGCASWCQKHGSPYGVCGDGHTCICRQSPIKKINAAEGCTCDQWCRTHGHKSGGICGDGYTCICSK